MITAMRPGGPPHIGLPYSNSHDPELVCTLDRAASWSGSPPAAAARARAATACTCRDWAGVGGGGNSRMELIQSWAAGVIDSGCPSASKTITPGPSVVDTRSLTETLTIDRRAP